MKLSRVGLVLVFLAAGWACAEDLKPPVPMSAGDNSDLMPPPVDLNQLTPLPLPMDMPANPAEPAKKDTGADSAAAVKALNAPSATPVVEKAAAPTSTPEPKKAAVPVPAPSTGTFADYFPTAKGTHWDYEYLKPAPGSKAKKIRAVESVAQDQGAAGTNATFQVTEDGKATLEKYSLSDGKVAQVSSGDQALIGEYAFQFPAKGAAARWAGDGKSCKAVFGKAQVYKKVYPDCVIVTEKTGDATVFSYYAKGIGLVAVEFYGKAMKLDQTRSFALVAK